MAEEKIEQPELTPEEAPEEKPQSKSGLFSNKKPVSSALKKVASKFEKTSEKEPESEDEPKKPSLFTQAEGDLKKRLGAEKADMIVERTDRDKIVALFEREQQAVVEEAK